MPTVITYSTVRNYSTKPASHPASTVQKDSAVSPSTTVVASSISELAALFGQSVIAWVNGKTFTAAPCQPVIKKKRPRTQFITLSMDTRAARGFRPTPRMPIV